MQMVTFSRKDGTISYGTLNGDRIRDAGRELPEFPDLKSVLAAGAVPKLEGLGDEVALSEVTLLPPLTFHPLPREPCRPRHPN